MMMNYMNRSLLVFILLLASLTKTFSQGQLWGLTAEGGSDNIGAIFKINEDGTGFSLEKSFLNDSERPTATGALVEINGKFYGVTSKGGKKNMGTLFEYNPSTGSYSKKFEFDGTNGNCTKCGIINGGNGKIFGFTEQGGTEQGGILFQYDLQAQVFSKLLDFSYSSLGLFPRVIAISGSKLYAATSSGGAGNGALVEFDLLTNKGAKRIDFYFETTGINPISLLTNLNGKLYGINSNYTQSGVLFEFDPASGSFTKKIDFEWNNVNVGWIPTGLVEGAGGKLYGLVHNGVFYNDGNSLRSIFEYDPANGSYAILKNVGRDKDNNYIGSELYGYLTYANGKLYGRTIYGDPFSSTLRAIFQYDLVKKEVERKSINECWNSFNDYPNNDYQSRLSVSSDGKLYSFETNFGTFGNGYLFAYDLISGTEQKLFDFTANSNGSNPTGILTKGANGKLYGVTPIGGNFGYGTLFEYDPVSKQLKKKIDFSASYVWPGSTLVLVPNGRLYGLTRSGEVGISSASTIFEYDPVSERVEKVYDFGISDDFARCENLTIAPNGKLYGVAIYGKSANGGIFEFDPITKIFTKKHEFTEAEGKFPEAALTVGPKGKLYGTCSFSSSANNYAGTLFEYNYETNTVTKLADFDPNVTGSNPKKKLCFASDGKLYGIVQTNLAKGVLFQFDPVTRAFTKVVKYPYYGFFIGGLVEGGNKKLFGFHIENRSDLFTYDLATSFVKNKALENTTLQTYADVELLYTPEPLTPKENQTIVFQPLSPATLGDDPFYFSATATSSLPVRYSSSDPSIATVEGNKLTILKTGSVTITAYQDGNIYYDSAPNVQQVLMINLTSGAQLWGAAGDRIFSLDKDGSNFAFRKRFLDDSQRPYTDQLVSFNNKLYGATYSGGDFNQGIIFEYDPTTKLYSKKHDFDVAEGNTLNNTTVSNNGILYRFASSNGSFWLSEYNLTTGLYRNDFNFDQDYPWGLTSGENGKIYGTCSGGGAFGYGYLFEFDPVLKTFKSVINFDENNSGWLAGKITSSEGKIYGYNILGGANGTGVLYEYDPSTAVFSKIVDFTIEVGYPFGEIGYRSGKLYGLYSSNGLGVYEYDLVSKSIRTKTYPISPNTYAIGSLVLTNGVLVIATNGGATQKGEFLEFNPTTFEFTKKAEFDYLGGGNSTPFAVLNGKIYGAFLKAAASNNVAIAAYDPVSATVQEEISFIGSTTGTNPNDLAVGKNGKLYGTTSNGGVSNGGVIFELDPNNSSFVKKFDFDVNNGFTPTGPLVLTNEGKFYGITNEGGANKKGVIFEYDPSTNVYTKKADFNGTNGDNTKRGSTNFIFNENNGKWYGSTMGGGTNDKGVIFEFDPVSSALTKKFDLSDDSGFFYYFGNALTVLPNGKIYGITNNGGKNGAGTLFVFDPTDGTFSKKMDFSYGDFRINSGLKLATNGKLYTDANINGKAYIVEYSQTDDKVIKVSNLDPFWTAYQLTETATKKLYAMVENSIIEFDPTSSIVSSKSSFGDPRYGYSNRLLTYTKDNQTITFDKLAARTIGESPFELTATASSGLPVTFFSSDPTVSIKDNKITILKDGVATITAKQAGNSVYNAAADVQQTLIINKLTPSVSWANPSDIVYGTTLSNAQLNATASVEGTLAYSPASGTKLNAGSNQMLSVTFTPTDASNYSVANKSVSINVNKANQQLTFESIKDKIFSEGTLSLSAFSNSNLPVVFEVTPADKASFSGNILTFLKSGRIKVTASQAGNGNFSPASSIDQSFCINPNKPTISVTDLNTSSPKLTSSAVAGNQWFFNDALISSSTGQTFTATESGKYKVQVKTDDCFSEFSLEQVLVVTGDIQKAEADVQLFPNPVTDWLTITLNDDGERKIITLFNSAGQQLSMQETASEVARFEVSDFSKGVYIAKVIIGNQMKVIRFVKQ